MPLTAGTRLGHYDVTALLGEGGMGQVWQATDTQLNRQVALKILLDAFASDPDRLARFTREAQILASLNHPNIAAIHGIEEAEGTRALVLELVEGPTLADRIRQGAIPLDEALPIAKQIAEALSAAHEAGVIHRDLKPANIKVREDGAVKVLDFGLAKALDPSPDTDPSQSPTLTAAATQMGMIMGTAAYMSPEQARGKPVDRRADIWAFGVVLYEMLTGQRPFRGEDVSLTLAAVMTFDPDLDRLPDELPHVVRTYLARCLQKDPRQRIRDIGDVRLALEGAFDTPVGVLSDTGFGAGARVGLRPTAVSFIALATAITSALGVWLLTGADVAPADLMRFSIAPREAAPFGTGTPLQDLAVSADGSRIVYVSAGPDGSQLNLRPLDQRGGAPLRGGAGGSAPFVSPDGEWVGFVSGRTTLRKLSIVGGSPVTVTESPNLEIYGASWGTDDRIVFGTFAGGLFSVPGGGGEAEPVTSLDVEQGELGHLWPFTIGDRNAVLFAVRTSGGPGFSGFAGSLEFELAALDLDTREVRRLGLAGGSPHYVSTGHLVCAVEDGALRAAPFDLASLEVTGAPVSLVEGVLVKNTGAADFDVSRNGHLVYGTGSFDAITASRELIWTSRAGEVEIASAEPGPYRGIDLSPDGTRVAYGDGSDIWIEDLERGTSLKLTDGGGAYRVPMWTPDGERVAFGNWGSSGGLFWALADGAGEVERLTDRPGALQPQPSGFTPTAQPCCSRKIARARRVWTQWARKTSSCSRYRMAVSRHCSTMPSASAMRRSLRTGGGWPISRASRESPRSTCGDFPI